MLRRTICKLLLALVAQCLATALLLACAAGALASIKRMPWELLPLLTTAGAGAGAFLGGWLAARLIGERGLLWGLVCGAVSGAAVLLIALALRGGGVPFGGSHPAGGPASGRRRRRHPGGRGQGESEILIGTPVRWIHTV